VRRLPLFVLLAACSQPVVVAGDFRLTATATGFAVHAPDGGVVIDGALVSTRRARSRIELQFGSFRFFEPSSDPWSDGVTARLTATGAELTNAAGEPVAMVTMSSSAEGVLALELSAADANANRLALSFACRPEDAFLGFGAQADALNHRGHKVPIWTSEPGIGKVETDDPPDQLWFLLGARHASSYGLPTWLSNRGYVAALDFDGRSIFDLCAADPSRVRAEAWAGKVTLSFYTGAPAQALERATAGVLKRPRRPPAIAFAPWNDAIYGAETVR
jgi:hypothetical protein